MQRLNPYGGFKVDKNELSKLFYIIYNNPEFKKKDLLSESGFGTNKIDILKNYLKEFDLIDKNSSPTDLGKLIYNYDKYFEDEITLWVFLINWSERKNNPFLFYLINESIGPASKIELRDNFIAWANVNDIKTQYEKDFVGMLIAITLNSLNDPDAFQILNLLTIKGNLYQREIPYKTPPLLIGYLLFEKRDDRTTISFEALLKETNNIGKIFNLNSESLHSNIYALRDLGLITYEQNANLQQIVYIYQEPSIKLLEKYYVQS